MPSAVRALIKRSPLALAVAKKAARACEQLLSVLEPVIGTRGVLYFAKFEHRHPSPQNAVDLFSGKWASNLGEVCPVLGSGAADLFKSDERPRLAAHALGDAAGRLDSMSILELGPLEGAHTYQLEQLGAARVMAIEANAEAYLKCLIVKEILGLTKSRFVLGDVIEYLSGTPERFDIVFCSGVLYHMQDPVNLIKLISLVTDKCFVWTHYHDKRRGDCGRISDPVCRHGFSTMYYRITYPNMGYGRFWGGNKREASWMERDSILACFHHFGFSTLDVLRESRDDTNGASFSFAAARGGP